MNTLREKHEILENNRVINFVSIFVLNWEDGPLKTQIFPINF